jgi:hypothetical protein
MRIATSTEACCRPGDTAVLRRLLLLAVCAVASLASGCLGSDAVYGPPPSVRTQQRPVVSAAPPVAAAVSPESAPSRDQELVGLPHDDQGYGSGPLGRAGVLLDRAIDGAELAMQRGAAGDAARLAHLRMVRQARDLIATGDNDRAADLLERAIALDDGWGFGYLYLGFVHLTIGDREQAGVFLDHAAALLPPDPALQAEVAQLRQQANPPSAGSAGRW